MNIIHIINNEKFTLPYLEFINKNFDNKEHYFIIVGKQKYLKKIDVINNNIKFIEGSFVEWTSNKDILKKGGLVFIHGFFQGISFKLFLNLNPQFLKKINWVIWGGDLKKRNSSYKLITSIDEFLKMRVTKKFAFISTLVKNDYKIAQERYNVSGKYNKAIYINPITLEFLNNIKKCSNINVTNIQIGNSADLSNNHIQAIDLIEKFKSENIKVYCPLSYGDSVYAKEVIDYGKKVLGEKFVGITEYMNPEAYGEFLGRIDIAIFNNNRQQALGNIFALAYLEAKIYMRNDTTMWEDLVEDEGYNFYSIEDIKDYSFEEFISSNIEVIMKNKLLSEKRFDEKYIKNVWEKIFTRQRGD
ncbi:TDP-N-acetylfucosamine:lipid II N-acetylfucosaminyltransferase [Clostridium intestinale]|uniref:4-alpha-L-fucosyltransferase glycosyl transferase group 56 n=1 Tax=Clostridium intestinale DSM 6191 TaxID=1121320 RepID=A0A1M6DKQ7_9CLOT|nr:TDP-N-acetylfucosamine:lipid II N-acetylfucosaminyltransferase [Clostridium intestinale]SHI73846.1 4-alpha-L-fucosyltransferase glycosyl transferase group 56 [Clostridium intestinale DSM 6191]